MQAAFRRVVTAVLPCLAVLGAVGTSCKAKPPVPGEVARSWTKTLRQFQINPVFPPREDVQVGDVYLRRFDPALRIPERFPKTFLPIDLLIARADVNEAIAEYYKSKRLAFPATPASGGTGPIAVPSNPSGSPVFNAFDELRLRQVAFPDFLSMSISQGDLRALIPVEGLAATFGTSWKGTQQVDVKIPSAESYGLPAMQVLAMLLAKGQGEALTIPLVLDAKLFPPAVLEKLRDGQRGWIRATPDLDDATRAMLLGDESLYLEVLTEVFYARAFDIGISASFGQAFGAGVSTPAPPGGTPGPGTPPPPDGGTPPPANNGPGGTPSDPATQIGSMTKTLQNQLDKIDAQSAPGGKVSVLTASANHVGMRRTYAEPMAIGYRGLVLRVDAETGRILGAGAGSDGQAAPTAGNDADTVRGRITTAVLSWLERERPFGEFNLSAQRGDVMTFQYEAVEGGPTVAELEEMLEANAAAIATLVDWTGLKGRKEEDPLLASFAQGRLKVVPLD